MGGHGPIVIRSIVISRFDCSIFTCLFTSSFIKVIHQPDEHSFGKHNTSLTPSHRISPSDASQPTLLVAVARAKKTFMLASLLDSFTNLGPEPTEVRGDIL
jgi:hypothetical protein